MGYILIYLQKLMIMKLISHFIRHLFSQNEYSNNKNMNEIEKVERKITKFICFKMGKLDLNYIDLNV